MGLAVHSNLEPIILDISTRFRLEHGNSSESSQCMKVLRWPGIESPTVELPLGEEGKYVKSNPPEGAVLCKIDSLDFLPNRFTVRHAYVNINGTIYRAYDVVSSNGEILRKAVFFKESESVDGENYNSAYRSLLRLEDAVFKENAGGIKFVKETFSASARFSLDAEILEYKKESPGKSCSIYGIKYRVTVSRNLLGEYAQAIPLPQTVGVTPGSLGGSLATARYASHDNVVLSESVWQNLVSIDKVLGHNGDKAVLLIGSGGGTTTYAEAIHLGLGKNKESFHSVSLHGLKRQEALTLLFGSVVAGAYVEGSVERAEDGSLFVEDIDRLERTERDVVLGELARAIRTGEYFPQGDRRSRRIRNMDWIFAGTFDGGMYLSEIPPEFKRVLTGLVKIEHPLAFDPASDSGFNATLRALFLCFYFKEVLAHCANDADAVLERMLTHTATRNSEEETAFRLLTWGESQPDYTKSSFSPGKQVCQLADSYVKELAEKSRNGTPPSIRSVQHAAKEVVATLWKRAYGSVNKFVEIEEPTLGELIGTCVKSAMDAMDRSLAS